MIKKITDSKWLLRMGTGTNTNDFIIDAADNSVSKSALTEDEVNALPDGTEDASWASSTVLNASILSATRISDTQTLKLIAAHLDFVSLLPPSE